MIKRILKALWYDKVSLGLLIVGLVGVAAFIAGGVNMSYILGGMLVLNILFNANENSNHFSSLYSVAERFPQYQPILGILGLPATNKPSNRKRSIFEYIVLGVMLAGAIFMFGMMGYQMIF